MRDRRGDGRAVTAPNADQYPPPGGDDGTLPMGIQRRVLRLMVNSLREDGHATDADIAVAALERWPDVEWFDASTMEPLHR